MTDAGLFEVGCNGSRISTIRSPLDAMSSTQVASVRKYHGAGSEKSLEKPAHDPVRHPSLYGWSPVAMTGCSVWMTSAPPALSSVGDVLTSASTASLPMSAKFATATSTVRSSAPAAIASYD